VKNYLRYYVVNEMTGLLARSVALFYRCASAEINVFFYSKHGRM